MKKGKRHSNYGRGKDWKKRGIKQKQELEAKQFKADMRIIEKTSELRQFYLGRYAEITKSGERGIRRQRMAVKLTKEFARQNSIAWRL